MTKQSRCPRCGTPLYPHAPEGLCRGCMLKFAIDARHSVNQNSCGAYLWIPPAIEEISPSFPELEIISLLGRGGMGAVYQARQKKLDRIIALKILPPEISDESGFARRFAMEARALAQLSHRHIVTVYNHGERSDLYYFIMEFVDGLSLRQLIHSSRLMPRDTFTILAQVCAALEYAHGRGIVHRDIKPENILIDKQGQVKIADFGLATLMKTAECAADTHAGLEESRFDSFARSMTTSFHDAGTPSYMAPEQKEGQSADQRTDIYALGVVLYEMLTGKLPDMEMWDSENAIQDARLKTILQRTLTADRDERYQHAQEVKNAIEAIAASTDTLECNAPIMVQFMAQSAGDALPAQPNLIDWRMPEKIRFATAALRALARVNLVLVPVIVLITMLLSLFVYTRNVNIPETLSPLFIPFATLLIFLDLIGSVYVLCLTTDRQSLNIKRQTIAACLLSCAILPASIIGMPLGVYTLRLLGREKIRPVSGGQRGPDPAAHVVNKTRLWRMLASFAMHLFIWGAALYLLHERAAPFRALFKGSGHQFPLATLWAFDMSTLVDARLGVVVFLMLAVLEAGVLVWFYYGRHDRAARIWSRLFIAMGILSLVYFYLSLGFPILKHLKSAVP